MPENNQQQNQNNQQPNTADDLPDLPANASAEPVQKSTAQFDQSGFKYKRSNLVLIIWGTIIILGLLALGGFLLLTEQGKELIGLAPAEVADTEKASSSSSSKMQSSSEQREDIEERNFAEDSATETLDALLEDINTTNQQLDADDDFEDFNSEAEFGVEESSSSSQSSSSQSS